MRIAFSGTHFSGKSTLIKALQAELPEYDVFDEPYWILTELGRQFSDPPTIDEFEEQLECSIDLIRTSSHNALFDRCPIDFLAYALAISEMHSESFHSEVWETRVSKALQLLDLIIFLPLENPDRILVRVSQDRDLRQLVDEKLCELVLENSRGIVQTQVLEITGTVNQRMKKIEKYFSSHIDHF